MISKQELIRAFFYFSLVVIGEVVLHLSTAYFKMANDYTLPAMIFVFLIIAWLLKTNLITLGFISILVVIYGCVSFFTQFVVYTTEYPATLLDFAPTIMVKTLIYTFPIAVMTLLTSRK